MYQVERHARVLWEHGGLLAGVLQDPEATISAAVAADAAAEALEQGFLLDVAACAEQQVQFGSACGTPRPTVELKPTAEMFTVMCPCRGMQLKPRISFRLLSCVQRTGASHFL